MTAEDELQVLKQARTDILAGNKRVMVRLSDGTTVQYQESNLDRLNLRINALGAQVAAKTAPPRPGFILGQTSKGL